MTALRFVPLLFAAACSQAEPPPQAAAWSAARVRPGQLAVAEREVSGKVWIDGQPISVRTKLGDQGTLMARYADGNGNRVVGFVRADGKRGVEVNGQAVGVDGSGRVRADAFSGLSPALRAALGLVPLEAACRESQVADVLALPYNLLRRAEPDTLAPDSLIPAVSCSRESVRFHKGSTADLDEVVAPDRLFARARIASKGGAK